MGPNPGVCLRSIAVQDDKDFLDTWKVYVDAIDQEIEKFLTQPKPEKETPTIQNSFEKLLLHRIAMMYPIDGGGKYAARIPTRWIANRFLQIGLQFARPRCYTLYKSLSSQFRHSLEGEWLFKQYMYYLFCAGGRFTAQQLPIISKTPQLLEVETNCVKLGTDNYFTSANDLAEQVRDPSNNKIREDIIGKYFLPRGGNHSSCDGLLFTSIDTLALLQITIAERCLIGAKGINDFYQMLPPTIRNINIIFVIPAERIHQYQKLQIVPTALDITDATDQLTISQFQIVIDDGDIQTIGLPPGSEEDGEY